jgi:hypothetical protein
MSSGKNVREGIDIGCGMVFNNGMTTNQPTEAVEMKGLPCPICGQTEDHAHSSKQWHEHQGGFWQRIAK